MSESKPRRQQTLAVLLGASYFHRAPKLAQGRAFYNSAQDFQEYLISSDGLGLPRENVDWLFDDSRSPSDQLQDIGDFLDNRSSDLKNTGTPLQDLIIYYVGHGLFSGLDQQAYCFAIRATDERSEALTSIRASDLAYIVKGHARFLRKFLILDCCFSAAAYKEFQSGPLQVSRVRVMEQLPQKGTTLLCSASAQDVSLVPEGLPRTMFSDSLLRALRQGSRFLGPQLSLSELGDLVKVNLQEAYPNNWVRPEVHSPDQREGDIASLPLFPNPAYDAQKTEEARGIQSARTSQDEARREPEAANAQLETQAPERAEAESKTRETETARQKAEVVKAQAETEVRERAEAGSKTREAETARQKAQVAKTPSEINWQKRIENSKGIAIIVAASTLVVALIVGLFWAYTYTSTQRPTSTVNQEPLSKAANEAQKPAPDKSGANSSPAGTQPSEVIRPDVSDKRPAMQPSQKPSSAATNGKTNSVAASPVATRTPSAPIRAYRPSPSSQDWGECTFEKSPGRPARVDGDCSNTLDNLALRLQQMPTGKLVLVGYTAETEPQSLSLQRALNVKRYLTIDGPSRNAASRIETQQGGIKDKSVHFYFVPG